MHPWQLKQLVTGEELFKGEPVLYSRVQTYLKRQCNACRERCGACSRKRDEHVMVPVKDRVVTKCLFNASEFIDFRLFHTPKLERLYAAGAAYARIHLGHRSSAHPVGLSFIMKVNENQYIYRGYRVYAKTMDEAVSKAIRRIKHFKREGKFRYRSAE